MLPLSKRYWLLNFLNRSYSWPIRRVLAGGVWTSTALASFSPRLASHVSRKVLRNDLKTALRQGHWIASRSWMRLEFIPDRFFDFTDEMNTDELRQLVEFISSRSNAHDPFDAATDMLYVFARKAHAGLINEDYVAFERAFERYKVYADKALEILAGITAAPAITNVAKPKDNQFSKSDASAALSDFVAIANQNEIPWYVISGTFLGIVREGGWLDHDYDIDVGVNAEEVCFERLSQVFTNSPQFEVRKLDYQLRVRRDGSGKVRLESLPTMLKLIHSNGINLDLFIHYLEYGVRWHGSIIHRWDNYDFGLRDYELDGFSVKGPDDPDRYLTENYGDWKTPVTDFNCSTGTPNLTIVKNLFSVALFLKRVAYYRLTGDENSAQKVLSHLLRDRALIREENNERFVFNPDFILEA